MESRIDLEQDGSDVVIAVLHGEHDLATAPELRTALHDALADRKAVVVELSLTQFIDSTILGTILGGLRRARDAGLGFALVVAERRTSVNDVLELTDLIRVFPAYSDRSAAVAAARSGVNRALLAE